MVEDGAAKRHQGEPLNVAATDLGAQGMGQRDERQLLVEQSLGVIVVAQPERQLGCGHSVIQQLIEGRTAPAAVVVATLDGGAAQQLAKEVVGVGVVGNPARQQAVVLAVGEARFDDRPLLLHDFQLDADFGQIAAHQLGCLEGIRVVGARARLYQHLHLESVLKSGLLEQLT